MLNHLPATFLFSLASFLRVKHGTLCIDQSDVAMAKSFDLIKHLTFNGINMNAIRNSKDLQEIDYNLTDATLVICNPQDNAPDSLFRERYYWITDKYPEVLPLRLDSNYLKMEFDRHSIQAKEMYKIKGGPIFSNLLATWNGSILHIKAESNVWARRSNFQGATLINGYIPGHFNELLTVAGLRKNGTDGSFEKVGYTGELMGSLERTLNFTSEIKLLDEDFFGTLDEETNEWIGLVGELQRGNLDVSSGGMTNNYARAQVMDFTIGIKDDVATLIVGNPELFQGGSKVDLFAFSRVLSWSAWTLVLMCIVLQAVMASILKRFKIDWRLIGREIVQGCLTLAQCPGACMGTGMKSKCSEKVALLSFLLFALVIFSFYCADLTSYMTVEKKVSMPKSFKVKPSF